MYEKEKLEAVGRSAAEVLHNRHEWIHRRVESLSFPASDANVDRRYLSIDFTIPTLTPVDHAGHDRYYVPLSLIRKWPPLLRLDLTHNGQSVPFLTRTQNEWADAALLGHLAEIVIPDLAEDHPVRDQIHKLVTARTREEASRALLRIVPLQRLEPEDDVRAALRSDGLFTEIAGGLRDHTLLWLRVEGEPGDREIVKFAYDIPRPSRLRWYSLAAWGLRPFAFRFAAAHLGGSGSYHLSVTFPPPLTVRDTSIVLTEPQTAAGRADSNEVLVYCTARQQTRTKALPSGEEIELYTEPIGRTARFYVSGPRTGADGRVRIAVLPEKSGFVWSSLMAAVAVCVLLFAFASRMKQILAVPEPAVAVLLLVPAVLAYLLVRPAVHVIAADFLRPLRGCLVVIGSLPVIGAVAIVANGAAPSRWLVSVFWALAIAASVLTLPITTAGVFPFGNFARPISTRIKKLERELTE